MSDEEVKPKKKAIIVDGRRLNTIFETALGEIGVKRGEQGQNYKLKSNPAVLKYYVGAGHPEVKHDAVSWCAAFIGWVLSQCHEKNSGSLMARSYLDWGIKISQPMHGCIVVFERGPGLGHVALFDHFNRDRTLRCLGGNQADDSEVCFEDFPQSRVLGFRIPA